MTNRQEGLRDYAQVTKEVRAKLSAVSLVIVAAIYFGIDNGQNVFVLKLALLLLLLTMCMEIAASYLKTRHYALLLDGKITSNDFRASWYGKIAELLFYLPIIPFLLALCLFVVGFMG